MNEYLINALTNLYPSKSIYSIDEILNAYKDVSVQECYKLIRQSIDEDDMYCYSQGLYKVSKGKKKFKYYDYVIDKIEFDEVYKSVMSDFCCFNTSFLNQLTSLQKINNTTIIFVEGAEEKYFIDQLYKNNIMAIPTDDYSRLKKLYRGIDFKFDFLVKKVGVDTPMDYDENSKRKSLTIEGLLIDLLTDKYFKDVYSSEISNIYRESLMRYTIKIDRLMRYANKKHVKTQVLDLLDYISFDVNTGEFI